MSRVVPSILQSSPQLKASPDDLLPAFLKINNELRRINNDTLRHWRERRRPGSCGKERSRPSEDRRSNRRSPIFGPILYGGKAVDRQVHLGFDLAKTANAPVTSANHGKIVFAGELGIYGNCVVVDHGMGVQSLYAHLSSLAVQEGQDVRKGHTLGASGQTGLAGGDHLHFSMLLNGQFVNATEWWDSHWIEDRVIRKLRDAGLSVAAEPAKADKK